MKRIFFLILFCPTLLFAQDSKDESLGLPGDNLNLYAALKLFQECQTLEDFEKKLNSEEEKINNLDLDEDGKIDYIQVVDSVEGDVHNIALRIDLDKGETQNVAVFIVKKEKDGASIQVVGDEDLYGKDYIIEPNYNDSGTPNPGYQGNNVQSATVVPSDGNQYQQQQVTYVQVYSWPVVQYVYMVNYRPWRSPWYWGYYPPYWRPWSPYYWHYYYGYHYHSHYWYYGYYRRGWYYRQPGWHGWYYSSGWRYRSNRYSANYRAGNYRKTYSRPETLQEGSANFKNKYPTVATGNSRLPNINVPAFKPDVVKPSTRPGTKPSPGAKPGSRPTPGNPGTVTKPAPPPPPPPGTRPAPKPTPKPTPKPAPKPAPKPTPKPAPKPAPKGTRGAQ
jgi:hypothetical protein